jgi:GTP-binding protein LepA
MIGCKDEEIILASAKNGIGIKEILDAVVARIPAPSGNPDAPLKALIYDSLYDPYRGVIINFRVFDGVIREGEKVKFMRTEKEYIIEEVGVFHMKRHRTNELSVGNAGYMTASIRALGDVKVGDTITTVKNPTPEPIGGFKEVKPMVFSGIYPADSADFEDLREALAKLSLNDAALSYEPETSKALGFGFRCGFLGMLHMDIVQERLDREFKQTIVTTVPSVRYRVETRHRGSVFVSNPSELPDPGEIEEVFEPYIKAQIITPAEYIGNIMKLCMDRRGQILAQNYITTSRVELVFDLPLAEIVFDFYDKLKSTTRGYASLDYEFSEEKPGSLVKLDMLLNGDPVDALSSIVHRDKAYDWGKRICEKLKDLIPQQMFEVVIQAAIGHKIISRTTVRAMRKNVTAKCYGGDISRKRKLLDKQKEGKKRMKQIGSVEVPQEAFHAVLSIDN